MKIKRKLVQICLLFAVPLQAIICDAQTLQTLYSFNSGQISPNPNLTLGPDGNLYGTTYGDANGDSGLCSASQPMGQLQRCILLAVTTAKAQGGR